MSTFVIKSLLVLRSLDVVVGVVFDVVVYAVVVVVVVVGFDVVVVAVVKERFQ